MSEHPPLLGGGGVASFVGGAGDVATSDLASGLPGGASGSGEGSVFSFTTSAAGGGFFSVQDFVGADPASGAGGPAPQTTDPNVGGPPNVNLDPQHPTPPALGPKGALS